MHSPGEWEPDVTEEQSASEDNRPDESDVVRFAHITLRENLHLTVNGVLSTRFKEPRIREALTEELLKSIDAVVDDHIAAEELGRGIRTGLDSPAGSSGSVDRAMYTLKERLQTILGSSRPGIKQGASAAMKLAPSVVVALQDFVHDDVKFGQAQTAASALLSHYLHPMISRQVVSFAATAARRATPKKGKEVPAEDTAPDAEESTPSSKQE